MSNWYVFKSEPLKNEGNLKDIYKSKFKRLPEKLSDNAFRVSKEDKSQALDFDMKFRANVEFFGFLKEGTYFIVDVGHAHLPGIATLLIERGFDCYFVIPEKIHRRFHETLKYWSREFDKNKRKLREAKKYVTLIDCHRNYKLKKEYFPEPQKLKDLEIKKVIYLFEGKRGKYDDINGDKVLNELFKNYKDNGIIVEYYGILPKTSSFFLPL